MRIKITLLTVCCGALLLTAPATAQQKVKRFGKEYVLLPEKKWGTLAGRDVGKLYCLDGRWEEVWRNGIKLYKTRSRVQTKNFLYLKPRSAVKDQLVKGIDSNDAKLKKRHSMVRVFGKAIRGRGVRMIQLEVLAVDKQPDEADQYRARLKACKNDIKKIEALAKECEARAKFVGTDPALLKVHREILRREMNVKATGSKGVDWPDRLRLAKRFHQELKDLNGAIERYAEVYEHPKVPKKYKDLAEDALEKLDAERTRDASGKHEWVSRIVFLKRMGFVVRKGIPMRKEHAELDDAILSEIKRQKNMIDPPRKAGGYQLGKDAEEGGWKRVRRGMYYSEVLRAIGPPRHVFHKVFEMQRNPVRWTQWIMPDGARVYFAVPTKKAGKLARMGEVISKKSARTPLPTK